MNKKYCIISCMLFGTIIFFSLIIVSINNQNYAIMSSIFIPILFGILINYDNKKKNEYKYYYKRLYYFTRTYYDILSQPSTRLSMVKKHTMISSITKDLLFFLNENINYVSEELNEKLVIMFFYKYENEKTQNEFQDVYNVNMLLPEITKELVDNYNVLNIDKYMKRKRMLLKRYHEVNGIIYLYVDSFIMDIARQKGYILGLGQCVNYYKKIEKYRNKNYKEYYNIYKYIKKNRNTDINIVIRKLNEKFNIKIKKLK